MGELCHLSFESGNLTGSADCFGSATTDGGDLSVAGGAALVGSYGLQHVIDDTNAIYGTKTISHGTNRIRFRFYLDPNGLTMASGDSFTLLRLYLSGSPWSIVNVYLTYWTGIGHRIQISGKEDDGTTPFSSHYAITDDVHYVEIDLVRATNSSSADGSCALYIDGSLKETLSGLDNYDIFPDIAGFYWGAYLGLDAGTSGTFYQDDLVCNDDGSEIGPAGAFSRALVNEIPLGTLVGGGLAR